MATHSVDDRQAPDMIKTQGDGSSHGPHPITTDSNYPSLDTLKRRLSDEIERRRKAEKALQNSEDRYRSIFENTGTATVLIEPDMTISMANAKAGKVAGIPRDQFVGRSNALNFITPKHRDRVMLYHELLLKGDPNAPQQFEFQIKDKNGAVRDILANVQLVPESQQTVASLLDITEKSQLQKERQRLAAIIDQSAEAVIMTDKRGRVEYINQAFEKLSGFCRDDCIGQTLEADFFCDQDRKILKQMTFMVSGKDSWNGRVENQRQDNRAYIADTRIFPICDEKGNAINLVCVKTDATHEVQLEKQLQQAQKMEAIGTLAGGIAHDFNNILGGILGYAEITMIKVSGDSHLKRNLDRILDGCQRAKELVQNILTFSRKSDEEIKPIEIQVIVKEALKLLRASIPSTVEFKQRIGSDPSIVCATPTQVHQIIMNLCTNASHAMQKEGGILEVILENIELTAAQCKGKPHLLPGPYCRLSVCDTGEGMDPKILDRIFEPYFTTKEQTGGTGLGLSVVHGIVKNFSGTIQVASHPGKGTTFDIYLPRIENTLDTQIPIQTSLPPGKERILVADDELFILEIMTDMLSSLGYEVETANGGIEAIEKFSSVPEHYDIVIADLTMPKLTGTQLAMKIKQLREDIPIILTTGMTFDANIGQDQFKEFAAVMNKPILYQDLAKTLRKVLDKPDHQ
jgi:PAS domain S-box-containing protein